MAFLGESKSANHRTPRGILTHSAAYSIVQETTTRIEKLRDETLPLQVVKAKYVEEKLSNFVKDLKKRVDNTEVLVYPSYNFATVILV